MPGQQSPTLRLRRLATELRKLREASGLTSVEVAKRLEWSPGKLTRMERGEGTRPNPRDIEDLLKVYGVTGQRQREEIVRWAREARQRGWWHPYREMLSESLSTYIGLEAGAKTLLTFQSLVVPGLLQTEDYARVLIQAGPAEIGADEIEQRVKIRKDRQQILTGPDPARLWAIIDEAALRRPIGGRDVMRAQMDHLKEMARSPRITLQVIPFDTGAHAGLGGGSFTILQFPDEGDHDAVYVDNFAGELFVEEPPEVARFHTAFRHIGGAAAAPSVTVTLLETRTESQHGEMYL